jgi:hypothetical protein
MLGWSPRTWVLGGFAISFTSVVINTFVLANISGRLSAVSAEQATVRESLTRMAAEVQQAESKYELVRVFHWVAMRAPKEQRETARAEVAYQLVNYFTRTHAAVNDIPPVEVVRTEMIELEDDYAVAQKAAELMGQRDAAKTDQERDRLNAELQKLDLDAVDIPKTELGKQFHELEKIAYKEADCDDEGDLLLAIAPTLQKLREQFTKTHALKTRRLEELGVEKARLQGYQQMATYLAIGLQLLGLSFILSRDVVKDIHDTRKKQAEEESPKAPDIH